MLDIFVPGNRLISYARAIISFLSFLILMNAFGTSSPEAIVLNAIFGLYAVVSFTGLIISIKNWYLDYKLSNLYLYIDIIAYFIAVGAVQKFGITSIFISGIVLIGFCFSTISQKEARQSYILVFSVLITTMFFIGIQDQFFQSQLTRDLTPFLALGIIVPVVMWIGLRVSRVSLPSFLGLGFDSSQPISTSIIDYARAASGAPKAALCWFDREDLKCYVLRSDDAPDGAQPLANFTAAGAINDLAPMLFDWKRDRSLMISATGAVGPASPTVPGQSLLREVGFETGICMPIFAEESRRLWIILSGIPNAGWGHLVLVQAIADELSQGAGWHQAAVHARNEALRQLRKTVASDLHDSVAHSLAGTRFLLGALVARTADRPELQSEVASIRTAIDDEYTHIRGLIEQLRVDNADQSNVDLIEYIGKENVFLAKRWQVDVRLIDSDFRIPIPLWAALIFQQIVREAVSNAVRHAQASQVRIFCSKNIRQLSLKILNNFDSNHAEQGFQPRSITDRLREVGGTLSISSASGWTELDMTIPVSALTLPFGD